jgi:hypothetical protein
VCVKKKKALDFQMTIIGGNSDSFIKPVYLLFRLCSIIIFYNYTKNIFSRTSQLKQRTRSCM